MSQRSDVADRIRSNWLSVTDQVRRSAIQAGRDPSLIRVIGVSKYVDEVMTKMLVDAGCRDLGESRPQLLWHKADYFKETDCGEYLLLRKAK